MPVDVNMQAWIKIFENLGLDVHLGALNDAFRENNVELFKDVLSNILNNLTISELVKVKVKMSLVGGDAHVSGAILNGAPEAMVAMVAIVALLLGFILSGSGATGFSTAVVSIAVYICYWNQSKPKTTAPLVDPRTALVDRRAALGGTGSAPPTHIQQLMDKAKMPKLTHEQEHLCMTLAKSRHSHVIVSQCKHMSSAFVAQANSGVDLSYLASTPDGSMTKEAANALVKKKVESLNDAILSCDDANWKKKDRYVQLAEFQKTIARVCMGWTKQLKNLEKQYGPVLSQIKALMCVKDDFAVAKSAVQRRDRLYQTISEKVVELLQEVANVSKKSVLSFTLDTVEASRSMMQAIVHSSSLLALQKDSLAAAMKESDQLFRRRIEASDAVEAEQADLATLTKEINDAEHALDRQISSVHADLALAASVKSREGQGFWRMKGTPNDQQSRSLKQAWDSGNMSELKYYVRGDFELRFVSELSASQEEVRKMQAKLELDLKKKQADKEYWKPKKQVLAVKRQRVQHMMEMHDKTKKDYQMAEEKVMLGINVLPPLHSAQIKGMQRVSEAMSQAAKTFQPCRAEVESFQLLLDDLQAMLEDKNSVKLVLEAVVALSVQANDVEVSSLILLKNLGESNINDFLLPAVDPGTAWHIEEEDLQVIVDECERQPPVRVAIEVE